MMMSLKLPALYEGDHLSPVDASQRASNWSIVFYAVALNRMLTVS